MSSQPTPRQLRAWNREILRNAPAGLTSDFNDATYTIESSQEFAHIAERVYGPLITAGVKIGVEFNAVLADRSVH